MNVAVSVVFLFGLLASTAVFAQNYPDKPIRLVVPLPPGASAEMLGRTVGNKMSESIGRPIFVDNRPGAGGMLGSQIVARSAPDGYTLLLGASQTHAIGRYLSKQVLYDPVKDFTPITAAVEVPIALVVHPSFPANTAMEFVEYARKNPGKVSFGSSGTGSPHHLAGELLKQQMAIDMVHVPYKGGAPALQDLIGGQIPVLFMTLSTAMTQKTTGKIRVLAVVEGRRQPSAPDVPTMGESVRGYAMPRSWFGFFGPAGLAAPVLKRLNTEFVKALHAPDVKAKLEASGLPVIGSSAEELGAMLKSDLEMYRKIITAAGIQPE